MYNILSNLCLTLVLICIAVGTALDSNLLGFAAIAFMLLAFWFIALDQHEEERKIERRQARRNFDHKRS